MRRLRWPRLWRVRLLRMRLHWRVTGRSRTPLWRAVKASSVRLAGDRDSHCRRKTGDHQPSRDGVSPNHLPVSLSFTMQRLRKNVLKRRLPNKRLAAPYVFAVSRARTETPPTLPAPSLRICRYILL
jgi:hypothetical protein